jgi:RNA polymerase sigma-70 factor (ECF subfamily)
VKRSVDIVGPLYREHHKAVRSTFRRLGVDGAEADDLVQNVFVVAQRRIAKLPKDAEGAKRWLLDTARKHAANWHRLFRHQYEVLGWDEPLDEIEVAAEPANPEAHLALRDLVRRAIGKLAKHDREILVRHLVEGESLEELAKQFSRSKSGAHVRVERAAARVRMLVSRYESER